MGTKVKLNTLQVGDLFSIGFKDMPTFKILSIDYESKKYSCERIYSGIIDENQVFDDYIVYKFKNTPHFKNEGEFGNE